jgi:hypothetical protein
MRDLSYNYINIKEVIMNIKDFRTENSEERVKQTYEKYKDYSQDELMQELLRSVNAQKQNGTFDKQRLISTLSLVLPSLNDEQRSKLEELLSRL